MNVQEFSAKHSMKFFVSTIVLLVCVVVLSAAVFGRVGGRKIDTTRVGNQQMMEQGNKANQKGTMQKKRVSGQSGATVDFQDQNTTGTVGGGTLAQ